MTGLSSNPRGEKTPRPGAAWQTELRWTGEHVTDDQPQPRANRATRRAARRKEK